MEMVKRILSYLQTVASIEEILDNDPDAGCFSDEGLCEEGIFRSIEVRNCAKLIDSQFERLRPNEVKVLRKRFGFDDNDPWTLEQCGGEIGVTREHIRQIEAAALRKLRHPHFSKRIIQFY